MKFNWGTGIVLFMLAFMVFIISLVVGTSKQRIDLVAEDIYRDILESINLQLKRKSLSLNI